MKSSEERQASLNKVLELVTVLNEDMNLRFERDGITASRAHLLWELHQRGPSTQHVLADAMQVSARNITGLVDALVATGFVTREPHPHDRRARLVTLTDHGAHVMAQMGADHVELADVLFAQWPASQFECFVRGLDDLVASIRREMEVAAKEAERG